MNKLFLITLIAVLGACASPGRIAALDNEPLPTEREISERRALLSGQRQMQPTSAERFDIAVVGGGCAPKLSAKFAVVSCVNEQACNGHGLRSADGSVACACYELRGGCQADTFCNQRTRQCTKLPADAYHTR